MSTGQDQMPPDVDQGSAGNDPVAVEEGSQEENPAVSELSELLRQKDAALAELEEHVKRLSAEFANFRRRQEEESKRHSARMREELFRSLLPIVDNLERALAASQSSASAESLIKGVELVDREIRKLLEQHGVRPIDADGKLFDPAQHEAVMTEDREDVPDQTIVQELQRGYTIDDRVLRPSMVKVARSE